jgi:hypothetical protein
VASFCETGRRFFLELFNNISLNLARGGGRYGQSSTRAGAHGGGRGPHTAPARVASLGVQARLVPVDPAQERDLAGLLVRDDRVCREWD